MNENILNNSFKSKSNQSGNQSFIYGNDSDEDLNIELKEISEKIPLMKRYGQKYNHNDNQTYHSPKLLTVESNIDRNLINKDEKVNTDIKTMRLYEQTSKINPRHNSFSSYNCGEGARIPFNFDAKEDEMTKEKIILKDCDTSINCNMPLIMKPVFQSFQRRPFVKKNTSKLSMLRKFFSLNQNDYKENVELLPRNALLLVSSPFDFFPSLIKIQETSNKNSSSYVDSELISVSDKKKKKSFAIVLLALAVDAELDEGFFSAIERSDQLMKLIRTIARTNLTKDSFQLLKKLSID